MKPEKRYFTRENSLYCQFLFVTEIAIFFAVDLDIFLKEILVILKVKKFGQIIFKTTVL